MSTVADPGTTDTLADRIAAAVLTCPGVVALHGGPFGTVATYLPGRQVVGIRLDDAGTGVEIHVAGRYPVPIAEIARQVRAATRGVPAGPAVAVTVEDYL